MERLDRQYMPLDGEEIVQIIERKVGAALRRYNQYFGRHLVRHNPLIRLAVKVECFTPEGTPDDGGFEVVLKLTDGPIVEPDRVRDECGLGVWETKLVDEPSGHLADVKMGQRDTATPDTQATLEKVAKLLDSEPKVAKKSKPKRRKGGHGWPKGKKRGKKTPTAGVPGVTLAAVSAGGTDEPTQATPTPPDAL
jgi:hypothetical protein